MIVEMVESEKNKIIQKEDKNISSWTQEGKVAYYYLDTISSKLKELIKE